jgi:hypothetical protein
MDLSCLRDKVVLSKIVLSNFHPKQPNKLIGGPGASEAGDKKELGQIIELFIGCLT